MRHALRGRDGHLRARGGDPGSARSAPLKLEPAEAAALAVEARAFAAALADSSATPRFERLAASAASGEVADDQVAAIETMIELLFRKDRPSNRAVLQSVYSKTPRGQQQARAARAVNRALASLEGQTLTRVRVAGVPGGHTLTIETDRVQLGLELDSTGARVTTLDAG